MRILIIGVTSSGKGRLAFELAKSLDAEIISVDSMKVYRRMDIGTAKPPKEIRDQIPYHLIDVVEPSESFSVARFLELAQAAIDEIENEINPSSPLAEPPFTSNRCFLAFSKAPAPMSKSGQTQSTGTDRRPETLYEQLQKIDPDTAAEISPNDERRIIRALEVYKLTGKPISTFQSQWNQSSVRLDNHRPAKRKNRGKQKNQRESKKMIDAGLVDEVKGLLAEPKPLSNQARCAIGYAEIIDHLSGKTTLDEAIELIKKNTRKLAKAQRTWFKTFKNVHWLDLAPDETIDSILARAKGILNDEI